MFSLRSHTTPVFASFDTKMANNRIFTKREIENLIAEGQTIIIFQNNVLRVSNGWKERHPGGRLVLDHMIGRDATDEIDAYVHSSLHVTLIDVAR